NPRRHIELNLCDAKRIQILAGCNSRHQGRSCGLYDRGHRLRSFPLINLVFVSLATGPNDKTAFAAFLIRSLRASGFPANTGRGILPSKNESLRYRFGQRLPVPPRRVYRRLDPGPIAYWGVPLWAELCRFSDSRFLES